MGFVDEALGEETVGHGVEVGGGDDAGEAADGEGDERVEGDRGQGDGRVGDGGDADFTVLDLGAEYAVDPGTFLSKGRATPFAGWKVQGRAVLTVVGGKEVYDDNYESNR